MRVKFHAKFNWTPPKDRRVTYSYRPDGGAAGDGEYTVTRDCGERAVSLGRAVEIEAPSRAGAGGDGEPGSRLSAAQVAALDHDGDGRAGGSLPGRKRRARGG